MKHLDLFSGIGGFSLAASWVWGAEHEIVSFCEIDPFCQKVLKKHWPEVPIISDIRDITHERILADSECKSSEIRGNDRTNKGKSVRGRNNERRSRTDDRRKFRTSENETDTTGTHSTIDLLTGGFPCQPFSCAGKQRGAEDDRFLWPEMLRVIREIRPTWIIGENVAGIINMELDRVLSDLEGASYEVQPFLIPACGIDAPHRRDRVWIVAYNSRIQSGRKDKRTVRERIRTGGESIYVADNDGQRLQNGQRIKANTVQRAAINGSCGRRWLPEPDVGRVVHGVSQRVDRLKGLGNAIVPQVVVPIMQAIKELNA